MSTPKTKKSNWFMKGLRNAAESRKIASQEKKTIKAEKQKAKERKKELKDYEIRRKAMIEKHRHQRYTNPSLDDGDDEARGRVMEGYNDPGSKYSYGYGGQKRKTLRKRKGTKNHSRR
jgi:hypothetical protein